MAKFDTKKFLDFIKYYDEHNSKHQEAFQKLAALVPDQLDDDAEWVKTYREKPPAPAVKPVLDVRYFSQRDNYRDASRTCFSSSCAMLTEYLKPGTLPGDKGDDKYVEQVFKIGDSTDASVQVQTLKHFGVAARFASNGTFNLLDSQLAKGIPVPVGILHHGPASAPTGGGHWLVVIGKDGSDYIVNDPWGEIDNASGTYPSSDGKRKKYSHALMKARWTVEGDGTGYCIIATK
jgi:hypothetical protein